MELLCVVLSWIHLQAPAEPEAAKFQGSDESWQRLRAFGVPSLTFSVTSSIFTSCKVNLVACLNTNEVILRAQPVHMGNMDLSTFLDSALARTVTKTRDSRHGSRRHTVNLIFPEAS